MDKNMLAYHQGPYLFCFLPFVMFIYAVSPKKIRRIVLLLAGYVFFWSFSRWLVIYLIGMTTLIYGAGLWIDHLKTEGKKKAKEQESKENRTAVRKQYKAREKRTLIAGIVILLGILAYLKYCNFFVANLNRIFTAAGKQAFLHPQTLLIPIGISFYTLEAVGYMADVYWGRIRAEKNWLKIALFLGFFPQIMEGPISTWNETADAIWECRSVCMQNLAQGAMRIVWGLFKKMVIADRLYVIVQAVFEQYEQYHGVIILVGAVTYTLQLYMEFSGCMDIVIGSGNLFGVALPENFRQPFFAGNASEFWRRWHITLGAWLKAYVFYPVSVSGLVKKWNHFGRDHIGKYLTRMGVFALTLFPVWISNGLWHGAQWNYIFYGMYYFVILLAGEAVAPAREWILKKFRLNEKALYWKIPQTLKTWAIIFTGEMFFRANGLKAGIHMFRSIFYDFGLHRLWDGSLLHLGLTVADLGAAIMGVLVVAVYDILKERELLNWGKLQQMSVPVRWSLYYALIFAVILFGAYGIGYQQVDLIYAGF